MAETLEKPDNSAADRYFTAINAALSGLDTFLRDDSSPLYKHGIVAEVLVEHIARLEASFACWQNRLGFVEKFRISRAESGYPVFQNVLELENDKAKADERLSGIPDADELRAEMADFILRHKAMPVALQKSMAERLYLESLEEGEVFSPYVLPRTIRVSVNPTAMRPYYLVHWAAFDGTANLPMVYMAAIEDSSEDMVRDLVTRDGKLNKGVSIPLPVDGLLNPDLAHKFDDFCSKNSSYSLSPATIATNMDKDFPTLHPKQVRRIILGPFYSAGITENNSVVTDVLSKVFKPENAWLLTWTVQEVQSKNERPGERGFWSSTPAMQDYLIDTDNLEAARMGVSAFEKHALLPHEAYQALYASGEAQKVFDGYKVHIISNGQVISDV